MRNLDTSIPSTNEPMPVSRLDSVGHAGVPEGDSKPNDGLLGDYWHSLINEKAAADYLGLTRRTMQGFRCRGGGPTYVRISCRCIRYRRVDLQAWADNLVRTSTSDSGRNAA